MVADVPKVVHLVVEQDARWPKNTAWTRVATVFRVTDMRVSAALRFADLRTALEFAYLYRELAATERGALMSAGV